MNASVPAKTVDELVAHIKANPGKLSYATANTTSTVAMAWLAALKDPDVVRVQETGIKEMTLNSMGERSDAVLRTAMGERSNAVLRTAMGERSNAVLRTAMGERSDAVLRTAMAALFGPAKLPPST